MKVSNIIGVIRRRILVNYRIAPALVQSMLPPPFRPKLHGEFAIAGICLIRLEQVRPKGVPAFLGANSENAAHRVAVVWEDEQGQPQEGVYISRRDSDSRLNQLAGGRIFPGEHHAAVFNVKDDGDRIDFNMISKDNEASVLIRGRMARQLPSQSGFKNVEAASNFFEPGSLGYSATQKGDRLEGLRLKTLTWKIAPMEVGQLSSSFFGDEKRFAPGSIAFDCALVMRDIEHEWLRETDLYL
jgi:hypothetical protein